MYVFVQTAQRINYMMVIGKKRLRRWEAIGIAPIDGNDTNQTTKNILTLYICFTTVAL